MDRPNITQEFVDNLKFDPTGKANQIFFDRKDGYFGVQVGKTKKSFVFQSYKRPRKVFADVSDKSVKDARTEAMGYKVQIDSGIDPWNKEIGTSARTLRDLVKEWLDSPRSSKKGPRRETTIADCWDQLERFVGDLLDKPFDSFTRPQMTQRFAQIQNGKIKSPQEKPRKGKEFIGTESQAQAVFNYLRAVYTYAEEEYDLPSPISARLKKLIPHHSDDSEVHAALSDDELAAIGKALTSWSGNAYCPLLFKMMLFTGLRVSATIRLRFDYLEDDVIVLPLRLTGIKSNRQHVIPITPQIRAVIDELEEIRISDWMFPANSKSGHMTTINWPVSVLRDVSGVQTTNHSFRYTLSTEMERLNIDNQVQALVMDHAPEKSISDRYRMEAFRERVLPALTEANAVIMKKLFG